MIAMAGGLTSRASFEKLKINNIADPDKVTSIDVKQLILDKNEGLNVFLKPGDIITIPSYAGISDYSGQVQKPGTFLHEPGTLVSYYLGMAGGYGERANTRNIKINRWGGENHKSQGKHNSGAWRCSGDRRDGDQGVERLSICDGAGGHAIFHSLAGQPLTVDAARRGEQHGSCFGYTTRYLGNVSATESHHR